MSNEAKIKVFLSHAESDRLVAERIERLLQEASLGVIQVWRSSSLGGIQPGEVPWDKIHDELGVAGKVITVLTPLSCNRPWLLYESAYIAGKGGRRVIPLLCGVGREQIPSPLTNYKSYSADDVDQVTELIQQLISEAGLTATPASLRSVVVRFCEDMLENYSYGRGQTDFTVPHARKEHFPPGVEVVSRNEFTPFLLNGLSDPSVRKITIVTYTSEVDAALLDRFHIVGNKSFEIYKRSILSDLAEQQECNLRRIANNSTVRLWQKRKKSIDASERLTAEIPASSVLKQFLYYGPPTKRAYMLDDNEAIIAYYETLNDPVSQQGSIYKGMTSSGAIHVKRDTPTGAFMLDELINFTYALRRNSRTWEQERRILKDEAPWRGAGPKPCVLPKAVFFDLDGVLYDSLPQYVKAWQSAFLTLKVPLSKQEVYRQEGRRGTDTIREYLNKIKWGPVTDEVVEIVNTKKREVLEHLGEPALQDGARELVQAVADSGLEIFVVTGSSRSLIVEWIKRDFGDLIREGNIIMGQHVRAGKPNPDPYLTACIKANVHPHQAIAIENAPLGIEAASGAGVFCISVNTGILNDIELEEAGARVVFNSCQELGQKWNEVIAILQA
jgi:HAD superfamily hydrolase (TIGR01509 family)